jgi:hypothetical protein
MKTKKSWIRTFNFLAGGAFILLTTAGCNDFKNPDLIPAYITIDTIRKTVTPGQGSAAHDIKELYFYLNDEYLGAYAPDKPFPVLAEGRNRITFFAGIRENSIQDFLALYPLYQRYEVDLNFEQGKTITLTPEFRYAANAKFVFAEDFESSHILTETIQGPDSSKLVIDRDTVFEGSGSGKMTVTNNNPILALGTNDIYYNLPKTGAAIFLELNYKSNAFLSIGVNGFTSQSPTPEPYYKIILSPTQTWRKTYIRLNEEVLFLRKNGYQLLFRADFDPQSRDSVQHVYLDNVKLIHQ